MKEYYVSPYFILDGFPQDAKQFDIEDLPEEQYPKGSEAFFDERKARFDFLDAIERKFAGYHEKPRIYQCCNSIFSNGSTFPEYVHYFITKISDNGETHIVSDNLSALLMMFGQTDMEYEKIMLPEFKVDVYDVYV